MHVKHQHAGKQREDSLATPSAPHPTANLHRPVAMTCALTGFVMMLVWWGWPAPLDPLTQLLGRIPIFSRLAATASRPSWAFSAEAGLIIWLALLPAFLWRRLAPPAAWAATGGVLALVMTAAATLWQTSGVLIQIGAAVLTVFLNALLATVWVKNRSQGGNGDVKKEYHLAEKAPALQLDHPVADVPHSPPVSHDEDDAADEPMFRNRNPARSDPSVAQQRHAEKIGRYEILRLIGKGAMGEVFLGRDPRINRLTAIKTLRQSCLQTEGS